MSEFAIVVAAGLKSGIFKMEPDHAKLLADMIALAAAESGYAGGAYYLSQMKHLSREERNACIRMEFTGRNLREVCRKYGVEKTTVYRACKRGK